MLSIDKKKHQIPVSVKNFIKSFRKVEVKTIGEKKFSNGDAYYGQLSDNVMHGYGFYKYADSAMYEGEMHRGRRHGLGIYQSQAGELYLGEFEQNQRHGFGVKYCIDGQILNGHWAYGVFVTNKPYCSEKKDPKL